MKHKIKNPAIAALAAAVIVVSGSFTAVAAWHHLNPTEVAKETDDNKLADAFKGKDAISINKSQTIGDYKITLKSIVSGKDISSREYRSNGEIIDDRSYAVLSIEKKDGTPMAASDHDSEVYDNENFLVSPFIQGCDTSKINMYTLDAGVTTFMKDGIMYKLIDCNNLEIFADREVYIGVTKQDGDSMMIDNSAYQMDNNTGRISRNKNYSGINALFTLPLDKSKADRKKADAMLKEWLQPEDNADSENATDKNSSKTDKSADNWTAKKVIKEGVYLKQFTKNAKPDGEGMLSYSWSHDGMSSNGSTNIDDMKNKKAGTAEILSTSGDTERTYFEIATKEKDGSYTIRLYYVDKPALD